MTILLNLHFLDRIIDFEVIDLLQRSDHNLCLLSVDLTLLVYPYPKSVGSSYVKIVCRDGSSWAKLKEEILCIQPTLFLEDPGEMYDHFVSTISHMIEEASCVSFRKIKQSPCMKPVTWFNVECKNAWRNFRKCQRKC